MLQQHTAGAALTSGHVPPGSSRSWSMMYDRRVVTLWWRLIGHYKIETHKDHDMPSLPPSHTLSDWQTTHNGHLLTVTVLFTWLIDWLIDWLTVSHSLMSSDSPGFYQAYCSFTLWLVSTHLFVRERWLAEWIDNMTTNCWVLITEDVQVCQVLFCGIDNNDKQFRHNSHNPSYLWSCEL